MYPLALSDSVTVSLAVFQLAFSAVVSVSLWRLTAWQRKYEGLEGKLHEATTRLIEERFGGMGRQVDRHVEAFIATVDELKQRMVFGDADVRALGEIPAAPAEVDAYLLRLDAVSRATSRVHAAYSEALAERDEVHGYAGALAAQARAAGLTDPDLNHLRARIEAVFAE